MDKYREMWMRLVTELAELERRGVGSVHPAVVQSFMGFIWDSVELEVREAAEHEHKLFGYEEGGS